MNLKEKLDLLMKNKIKEAEEQLEEKICQRYDELNKLYNEIENSLKRGDTRILVRGMDELRLAKNYFYNWRISCSGDCITTYTLEMSETGIKKLEKDYNKIKRRCLGNG